METQAAVPAKRERSPYVFAVVYDTTEGLKVEECDSRNCASEFINALPTECKVTRVYKVSEVITPKVVVKL